MLLSIKDYSCLIFLFPIIKYSTGTGNPNSPPDWDYILFSQRWPISACMTWEEENSGHRCDLPNDLSQWLVHGLWPTKKGTDGPNTCDSAIHFDPTQLTPILDDLNQHWTNIEASTSADSFWKHEWKKHGTCAVVVPVLNSVFNYFNKGLVLNQAFNISKILTAGKILPNATTGYLVDDIYNAVKSVIGKSPTVECVIDKKLKEPLVSEIRVCLDKQLNLIDCYENVTSSCSKKKPILYLGSLPTIMEFTDQLEDFPDYGIVYGEEEDIIKENQRMHERGKFLLQFYRFIKFLMWLTL